MLVAVAVLLAVLTGSPGQALGQLRPLQARPPRAPGQPAKPESNAVRTDEDAIRAMLKQQSEAWNRGDLDGFMKAYWKSDNLTFFSGPTATQGWQATLDRYRKRYQSDGQEMGKLTFSEVRVDMLGPDTALVRGHWQLQMRKGQPGGLFTLLVRKFPEGWRIIHDHTSS